MNTSEELRERIFFLTEDNKQLRVLIARLEADLAYYKSKQPSFSWNPKELGAFVPQENPFEPVGPLDMEYREEFFQ